MSSPPSRRALLGALAIAPISGCFDLASDQDGCHISHGTWRGEAEATTTAVETDDLDDSERAIALAAAEAAFARLDENLDIDLEDREWISPGISHADQYDAFVRVRETRDRDGAVKQCPDSEFDIDDARTALPGHVTVTVRSSDSEAENQRSLSVELVSVVEGLD